MMKIPSNITQNIGKTLRAIRQQQQMSKSRVERHTGISRNTLRRIESGETENPGAKTVFKLLAFYEVELFLGYKLF